MSETPKTIAEVKTETPKPEVKETREIMNISLNSGMLAPGNLKESVEVAKYIAHSGMVPKNYIGNPGAVMVAIQMGAELGLLPMAAVQNIAVINGRPSLWGDAMLALVTAHPDCIDVHEEASDDGALATCSVQRRNRSLVVRTFSIDDAKKAGLWTKAGPWTQYPKRMLQLRARGFALRDSFPDALRGIASAEESRDTIVVGELSTVDTLTPGIRKFGPSKAEAKKTPEPTPAQKPQPEKTKEPTEAQYEEADKRAAAQAAKHEADATNTEKAGF